MMRVKEESEIPGLKHTFKKLRWAFGPITLWQIDGKKRKLTDFIFLGSKITVNHECIHAIKRHLLLGRKAMTNLDTVL